MQIKMRYKLKHKPPDASGGGGHRLARGHAGRKRSEKGKKKERNMSQMFASGLLLLMMAFIYYNVKQAEKGNVPNIKRITA